MSRDTTQRKFEKQPDPRIEALARRICEEQGFDPDAEVIYGCGYPSVYGPKLSYVVPPFSEDGFNRVRYAWELYGREARTAVNFFDEQIVLWQTNGTRNAVARGSMASTEGSTV
jgi:hypothetical protein